MNNQIYFGSGRRCINPEIPIGIAGYFNVRMWTGVADDIEVRVLVLHSGQTYCAIIQYDLIAVPQELWSSLLNVMAASKIDKICPGNMIVTATHSHTAPEVRPSRAGFKPQYIRFVAIKTIQALQDAITDLQLCTVEHATTRDNRFGFNRRYWMEDGHVATNPGKRNPSIVRPEGEIDPEIPLLAFKCNGITKALIVNIVNHSDTTGGSLISGDWPGFTIRHLQQELGAKSIVIPLIGCSGNINHFDVRTDAVQTNEAEAKRIGIGYAESISKALPSLCPMNNVALKTYCQQINIPPRVLSVAEIKEAQSIVDKYPEIDINRLGGPDLTAADLARKTPFALKFFAASLLKISEKNKAEKFNLVRLDIGNVVIASVPCEPFVEIGLTIRKGIFSDRTAMVASMANGSGTGYIPNCWNYGRGGYETTPRSNPYSPKTSELILAAWRELGRKA